MEDLVIRMVEEIFTDEELTGQKGFCTSEQCKLDVTCYALNRVQPRYIVSGRGLSHYDTDYLDKLQREADLASLIYRGIEVVDGNRRPHDSGAFPPQALDGVFFTPPTFSGRVFNSVNFEPVSDIEIALYRDGELVPMVTPNWQNPTRIVTNTPGTYSFWPKPMPAAEPDVDEVVEFEVAVDDSRYEPLRHYFQLTLKARLASDIPVSVSVDRTLQIADIYLVPK
jgi:competence protein ComFB